MKNSFSNVVISVLLFSVTLYWMDSGKRFVDEDAQRFSPPASSRGSDPSAPTRESLVNDPIAEGIRGLPEATPFDNGFPRPAASEDQSPEYNPYAQSNVLQALDQWLPFRSESLIEEYRESQFQSYQANTLAIGRKAEISSEGNRAENPYLSLRDRVQAEAKERPVDYDFAAEREERFSRYLKEVKTF